MTHFDTFFFIGKPLSSTCSFCLLLAILTFRLLSNYSIDGQSMPLIMRQITASLTVHLSSLNPLPLIIKVRFYDLFHIFYFPLCFWKRLSQHLFLLAWKVSILIFKLKHLFLELGFRQHAFKARNLVIKFWNFERLAELLENCSFAFLNNHFS